MLPWSRVDAVVVDRNAVRIQARDPAADWTTLRLDQTPNVAVLRVLVERRQAGQPVGDEGQAVN